MARTQASEQQTLHQPTAFLDQVGFRAGGLPLCMDRWIRLTSAPFLLECIRKVDIPFSSHPVQALLPLFVPVAEQPSKMLGTQSPNFPCGGRADDFSQPLRSSSHRFFSCLNQINLGVLSETSRRSTVLPSSEPISNWNIVAWHCTSSNQETIQQK